MTTTYHPTGRERAGFGTELEREVEIRVEGMEHEILWVPVSTLGGSQIQDGEKMARFPRALLEAAAGEIPVDVDVHWRKRADDYPLEYATRRIARDTLVPVPGDTWRRHLTRGEALNRAAAMAVTVRTTDVITGESMYLIDGIWADSEEECVELHRLRERSQSARLAELRKAARRESS